MKKIFPQSLSNFCKLLLLAVCLQANFVAKAQLGDLLKTVKDVKKGTEDVKKTVTEAQRTLNEIQQFRNEVRELQSIIKTTTGFNENVKVANGNTPNSKEAVMEAKMSGAKLEIKDGKATNLAWEYTAYFDNQLFPSTLISMATYKGTLTPELQAIKSSALGFVFYSSLPAMAVKWEIECSEEKYFKKQSGTYICEKAKQLYYFMPELGWNYSLLSKQETRTNIQVTFRVFDEKGNKEEYPVTLALRSVNDCIRFYKDTDLRFMYAAYVNEEHPEIDKILREGLNTKITDTWIGYQGTERDVLLQVAAIWKALHNRKFTYSSISANSGDEGDVKSQSVRTFDKAIKTSQANCVDGTVVFASILKKIGIKPVIILVPGHCFLGFYSDANKTKLNFLETTQLSNKDVINPKTKKVEKNAFIEAMVAGTMAYEEAIQKYPNNIQKIDLEEARQKVKPLPVSNN